MNFKMTFCCCTNVDRKDHVQYFQVQRAIPDNCTCSLTEQNIAINDHNDAMMMMSWSLTTHQPLWVISDIKTIIDKLKY